MVKQPDHDLLVKGKFQDQNRVLYEEGRRCAKDEGLIPKWDSEIAVQTAILPSHLGITCAVLGHSSAIPRGFQFQPCFEIPDPKSYKYIVTLVSSQALSLVNILLIKIRQFGGQGLLVLDIRGSEKLGELSEVEEGVDCEDS